MSVWLNKLNLFSICSLCCNFKNVYLNFIIKFCFRFWKALLYAFCYVFYDKCKYNQMQLKVNLIKINVLFKSAENVCFFMEYPATRFFLLLIEKHFSFYVSFYIGLNSFYFQRKKINLKLKFIQFCLWF